MDKDEVVKIFSDKKTNNKIFGSVVLALVFIFCMFAMVMYNDYEIQKCNDHYQPIVKNLTCRLEPMSCIATGGYNHKEYNLSEIAENLK